MEPTRGVSQLNTDDNHISSRNSRNRKVYKTPTRKHFNVNLPRDRRSLVLRQSGLGPVPRETFIAQIVNDGDRKREYKIYQVCFPEWLHDKLYVRSICGSKKTARILRRSLHVLCVFDYCAEVYVMFVLPAIGFTALGSAMASPDTIPPWFPFIGMFFYTIGFPMLCLSALLLEYNYRYLMNIDDKRLRLILCFVVFVSCICSPMCGIWTSVLYVQQDAAVAGTVEHTLGLDIGAYICCALSIPCWFRALQFMLSLPAECIVPGGWAAVLLDVVNFIVVTSLLVGSTIHQSLVGELVWFPYLGVVGTLFVIPLLCMFVVLLVLIVPDWIDLTGQRPDIVLACSFLLFGGSTDGFAWSLAKRDFSQPVEVLIDDSLLYTGAVFAYIALILIWVYVTISLAGTFPKLPQRHPLN